MSSTVDHAWNGHPMAARGASPSVVSDMDPELGEVELEAVQQPGRVGPRNPGRHRCRGRSATATLCPSGSRRAARRPGPGDGPGRRDPIGPPEEVSIPEWWGRGGSAPCRIGHERGNNSRGDLAERHDEIHRNGEVRGDRESREHESDEERDHIISSTTDPPPGGRTAVIPSVRDGGRSGRATQPPQPRTLPETRGGGGAGAPPSANALQTNGPRSSGTYRSPTDGAISKCAGPTLVQHGTARASSPSSRL